MIDKKYLEEHGLEELKKTMKHLIDESKRSNKSPIDLLNELIETNKFHTYYNDMKKKEKVFSKKKPSPHILDRLIFGNQSKFFFSCLSS